MLTGTTQQCARCVETQRRFRVGTQRHWAPVSDWSVRRSTPHDVGLGLRSHADLDSLVPASLKLLAPYYLQRLHEIAQVPARVLVAWAPGGPAMTVTDLAAEVATSTNTHR